VGKIPAKHVSTSSLKPVYDQRGVKVNSDWIEYFGTKACLYIGGHGYNCMWQLKKVGIWNDESRWDGSKGPWT
jgi:hypothetical protein